MTAGNLNLSGWNWTSANYDFTFRYCTFESLDVSNWVFPDDKTSYSNFFDNCKVPSLDLSTWNMSKATTIETMFRGCTATTLDVSTWDTSNITSLNGTFAGCLVKDLNVSNWDTSKVQYFNYVFNGCPNIEVLDLSSWTDDSSCGWNSYFVLPNIKVLDVSGFKKDFANYGTWVGCDISNVERIKFYEGGTAIDGGCYFTEAIGTGTFGDPKVFIALNDDTLTCVGGGDTLSGWYARAMTVKAVGNYVDENGNVVGNATEQSVVQPVLCTVDDTLNRQIPVSALGLDTTESEFTADVDGECFEWEFTGLYSKIPETENAETFDSVGKDTLEYTALVPASRKGSAVYAMNFTRTKEEKCSYVVTLPATLQMDIELNSFKAELPVNVTCVIPDSKQATLTVSVPGSFEMENQIGSKLTVSSDKQSLEFSKTSDGITNNGDGSYSGNGMFVLISDFGVGDWTGQVVVDITMEVK